MSEGPEKPKGKTVQSKSPLRKTFTTLKKRFIEGTRHARAGVKEYYSMGDLEDIGSRKDLGHAAEADNHVEVDIENQGTRG